MAYNLLSAFWPRENAFSLAGHAHVWALAWDKLAYSDPVPGDNFAIVKVELHTSKKQRAHMSRALGKQRVCDWGFRLVCRWRCTGQRKLSPTPGRHNKTDFTMCSHVGEQP